MLGESMMQEIIDMKLKGYSINEIIEYYEGKSGKTPSRPTIRKYYQMDAIPGEIGANYVKEKVFDIEPWKSSVIAILKNNPKCYSSSAYDVLVEIFVETGEYESLPGSERTLRTYINYLIESGQVEIVVAHRRIYDHVFDMPPGQQMIIDFGEIEVKPRIRIHFICMYLRYSRAMCVYAQDHHYNAEEACRAIYNAFCKLGGRPIEIVIDQDPVFVASEKYGEIFETATFKAFLDEQKLKLWVCNKADPESKGGVENLVGFVKKNYFSARDIECIDDVWRSLPDWVERKNKRIHKATFCVPDKVLAEIERDALRPLLPSVYDAALSSLYSVDVKSQPYIQYKSSKYSVPRDLCFKKVYYKVVNEKLHIYYGQDLAYVCSHDISPRKGSVTKLPEHAKQESTNWQPVCERLRKRWNCIDFQHFINGFKKENPRHLFKQLSAVEDLLNAEDPPKEIVAKVMGECCEKYYYRFSQFQSAFNRMKAGFIKASVTPMDNVQRAALDKYQQVFLERSE